MQKDPITVALTGMLPFVIIAGAVLALPAAIFLLWLYRRAVLRGMSESRGGSVSTVQATVAEVPRRRLRFLSLGTNVAPPAAFPSPWRAALVYAVAGAAFALTLAVEWLVSTHDREIGAVKVLFLFWSFAWPAALAVILVAAEDRARKLWIVLGYFAVYVALAITAHAISSALTWKEVFLFWVIENAVPTLLLYLFLMRRIRSVGPLVLVFAVIILLGSQLATSFLGASDQRMRAAVDIAGLVGLGGTGTFVATLLIGLLVFAMLGWAVLRWIGALYANKRLSDESITIDAIFLLFGISASVDFAFEHWAWIVAGFVAFAAYKVVAWLGFLLVPRAAAPKRLLLLRVFALGTRSEPLFDALRKQWLRGGNIAMIAGPDLVTSAIAPHEFLGFLSGRLGRSFIQDDAELERRLAAIDSSPDPDGRYRITEFFCHDDTWQPTLRRLVAMSDAVLMDLRSFSASNQGCVFELGRLLDAMDLRRVVFVIDETTDRAFLEATLQRLWSDLARDSPNRSATEPAARLLEVRGPTAAETLALGGHLLSA
jgi:hypothetical protein